MPENAALPPELVQRLTSLLLTPRPETRANFAQAAEERRETNRLLRKLAKAMRGEDPSGIASARRLAPSAELEATIAQLKRELEETTNKLFELTKALKEEQLNPASRSGLERVLISAVAGGYGANLEHEDPVRTIISEIVKDGENIGYNLDPKTVRKYVRDAVRRYKDHQSSI